MRKLENVKKWIWIPILMMLAVIAIVIALFFGKANASESLFNLSERDVLLEIGESKKVELESELKVDEAKLDVSWTSSKPSVATVNEGGTIVASEGGETKVTAVVEYKGKTYITSCMVTVKSEDKEYSIYKIRWYTQKQDRSGYDIQEESFERLIGSSVELTEAEANRNLPANYVLNKEKSTLTGKVKENLNGCILEVYFDVAQISYSVDYYYESDTKLGTYPTKETKKYTAYAFSKVQVTEKPKTGFVINEAIAGTVMSKGSVVSGSRLKVYCDRIRSKVTVSYLSGRASATYDCIYGIGLLNAPDDVFTDSAEYKITTYINGKKKKATAELMKTVTKDTSVAFGLDGVGFTYSLANGQSTITNTCSEKKTPCYAILNGSSNTIYLSATYNITGSTSNRFGITLSNGKTSRQIRFYKQGFAIMKDNTTEGGIPTAQDKTNALRNATRYIGNFNGQNAYVWAQNTTGSNTTEVNSVITKMLRNKAGGSYDVIWAVLDGVLYCNVEGQPVLCLPLTCLDETWTAGQKYQIGFSTYDGSAWEDDLQITNVNLALGKNAKALLYPESEGVSGASKYMVYDAITGSYIPAVKNSTSGAAYMYSTETVGDTGVSATVKWVDKENTATSVGVSVKMGKQSVEYVIDGQNLRVVRQENQKDQNKTYLSNQIWKILGDGKAFNQDGETKVTAFVKNGYFYVMYNGIQVQCINMLTLFPDYNPNESKVSVGLFSWNANLGLAKFSNVKELDMENDAVVQGAAEWGFYSETYSKVDDYSFSDGIIEKTSTKEPQVLLGTNTTWQIEGTMNREDDTALDLLMGFLITGKDKNGEDSKILITGRNNGFQHVVNNVWPSNANGQKGREYANNPSEYAFNTIVSNKFFNTYNADTRTQDSIKFKAVLYNDTLYVWFTEMNIKTDENGNPVTDENGNVVEEEGKSGLCWRIPLTYEQFGNFAEGSEYTVTLYMGSSDTKGSFSNLNVKMGYQVTGQTEFIPSGINETGETTYYSLQTALGIIDNNVTRWDSFQNKTIVGMLGEELDTSNRQNGTTYAYLDGSSSDIYLSATYELDSAARFFGISIKDVNGESRELLYSGNGVYIYKNQGNEWKPGIPALANLWDNYFTKYREGYTWVPNTTANQNTVYTMVNNLSADKEYDVKWAITDNVLYGMVDDFVFLKMPMEKLCSSWTKENNTGYQIGFDQRDMVTNGDVAVTKNIEVAYGTEALKSLVFGRELTGTTTSMAYEVFNGSYLPYLASGVKNLYGGTLTSESQMLQTTIKLTGTITDSNPAYGITVKTSSSKYAYVEVKANGSKGVLREAGSKNTSIYPKDNASIFVNGECDLTAVVDNSMLYVFFNGELAGSMSLQELIPSYTEGEAVQLGISTRNSDKGLATFTNVSFQGKDAVDSIRSQLNNNTVWHFSN